MPLTDITRLDVIRAVQECDKLGAEAFLDKYGFAPARTYRLSFGGRYYDSKAIIGAAHGQATGTPLRAADFSGGAATVGRVLEGLGFDVQVGDKSTEPSESNDGIARNHSDAAKVVPQPRKQATVTTTTQTKANQIKAEELPIRKIFSSDFAFRIPDYQRPYAWRQEQAVQLLEDLDLSMRDGSDEPYFLGSLVLAKPIDSPVSDVIDGQQRLTTLTILMAVLRDLSTNAKVKTEIESLINEPGEFLANIPSKPRLELRPKDNDFFRKYVQTTDSLTALLGLDSAQLGTDAQRSVLANAKAIHAVLTTWSETDRQSLARLVTTQTYLVIVTTEDMASAYRIFSVMNARGLNLSPTDIFKSNVIGAMKESHRAEYADKWESAEDSLSRTTFVDLFLHVRMIFSKERARRELLKEFPEQVLNNYLPSNPEKFVDDVLKPYADAYSRIVNQNYVYSAGAEKVNTWLRRLAQLDNNDWRPPALWAIRNHSDDPAFLDQFLQNLERLAASMLIRRVYATPRSMRYADLLKQLEAGKGLEAKAFDLSRSETKETRERLDGEIYKVSPVRKYVLLRLDEAIANVPGVNYDHKIISVEHVLPQHPSAGSTWMRTFTEAERDHWTHRLANLVLLNRSKNSEAQNYSFKEKKSKYFASKKGVTTFSLTSNVLHFTEWTPEVLEQRQNDLLTTLSRIWSL